MNPAIDIMSSQLSKTYENLKKFEKKAKEDRKVRNGPKRHMIMSVRTGKRMDIELNDDICTGLSDAIFREIYRTKP